MHQTYRIGRKNQAAGKAFPSAMNSSLRRCHAALHRRCCIDVRTLALFRLVLCVLAIVDLSSKWPDRCEFYSNDGVIQSSSLSVLQHNLHAVFPSCGWTTCLFTMHFGCTLLLLVGLVPRLACAMLWILYTSLHERNPVTCVVCVLQLQIWVGCDSSYYVVRIHS